jgi:hypothetical protein
MPKEVIFLFECDDHNYFALARERYSVRHLTDEFGELHWRLRRRLSADEMGAVYFQAARLLADRSICLLRLRSDGGIECACGQSILRNGHAPSGGLVS